MPHAYDTQINFFDDYWIDFKKNVMRRWYSPVKISEYNDPYCGTGCYHTAVWSPEQNAYLMWYEYLPDPADDEPRYLAVSESRDGITWNPRIVSETNDPARKIYPNTVYTGNTGLHGTAVFRDEHESDPARRYKACGCTRSGLWRTAGKQNSEIRISTSSDGLHWKEEEAMLVHPNTSDTLNCVYYNPVTREYDAVIRAGFVDRRICITHSADLKNWSSPKVCIHPGASFNDDAYAVQLYGLSPQWVGGCFLGFLWKYYTSCADFDYSRMNGFMDTELVYSYDGEHWMRTSGRPVIERPLCPEYGFSQTTISGFFETKEGDRYRILAAGSRRMHGTMPEAPAAVKAADAAAPKKESLSALLTYEIRKDGFCGLEANATDGLVVTKTFELYEPKLAFNLRADFGFVRFAALSHEGTPYDGFSFDDCVPFRGNDVFCRPEWKSKSLDELSGKRIRIAVEMNGAVIHAIYGSLRPWIRYPQVSLWDPRHLGTT